MGNTDTITYSSSFWYLHRRWAVGCDVVSVSFPFCFYFSTLFGWHLFYQQTFGHNFICESLVVLEKVVGKREIDVSSLMETRKSFEECDYPMAVPMFLGEHRWPWDNSRISQRFSFPCLWRFFSFSRRGTGSPKQNLPGEAVISTSTRKEKSPEGKIRQR